MHDCLFCKIASGAIPSHKVYEDDKVFAFLDIAPVNVGHTLVIPKQHFDSCDETTDEAMAAAMAAVRKVARAAMAATGAEGYNVGINCGAVAGQVVMHTHVHMMPRFPDDGLLHWGKRAVSESEMQKTAADMAELLKN